MRSLLDRDAKALLAVVGELAGLDDALPFPPELLAHVAELMHAETTYCELDRVRQRPVFVVDPDGVEIDSYSDEDYRRFFQLLEGHPVCGRRTTLDDWTSVYKVSDFASDTAFRRSEIYSELYRDNDVRYWIDVGIAPTGRHTRMFIFTREDRDFDERDRLVLELLQPHLQERYDRRLAAGEAADALATFEEGGAGEFSDIVLCSDRGVVEFASSRSRRLCETYFEPMNGRLPQSIRAPLAATGSALSPERNGRRLRVRATPSAGMLLVLLGEEDARVDRLTSRQREILSHVAAGATDAEVAQSLSVAPATVKKHLQKIYERLGVHTRTAAASVFQLPRA